MIPLLLAPRIEGFAAVDVWQQLAGWLITGFIASLFFTLFAMIRRKVQQRRDAQTASVSAKPSDDEIPTIALSSSSKPPPLPTYRVARAGVEIGQFGASEFFEGVHSGVIRLDDSVWMKGMVNWMPVSELLSPPAKDQQGVPLANTVTSTVTNPAPATDSQQLPPANSIASVSPPKTPVKEKFASIAKVIGRLLFSVLAILVIALVLIGGAKLAAWVQSWVEGLAGLTLGIVIPVCLLLLILRKTRGYGGIGIYFASYVIGLALWIFCFLYAVGVSVFWTVAGIVLGGLGIVPVAAIMTLIRRDWSNFGNILGAVVVVFVLRRFGVWIVEKSEQWNAEAELREQQLEEHAAKKGNYFAQHWHGQLSLGVSYWVSGFVPGLLVTLVVGIVKPIQETLSLRLSCGLSMFLFALAIASTVWWLIGVWRSASSHVSRGGRRFWAGVAEAMVVLGFLNISALTYKTYIPQSIEMLSIIVGDFGIPPYQIRVLPGGTDIEFRGGMRAGSARKLERSLAAVPQTKVLHIESPGGRIEEAKRMMKLVRERGLTTYTSEECESAATLVLVSGKQRVIGANAKVGFHAGTLPGITLEQQRGADDDLRSIMQSAGVSEAFIKRTLATPSDQMWFPSFDEMLQNGVATAQSYPERFATSIGVTNSAPRGAAPARTLVSLGDLGSIAVFATGSSSGPQWLSSIWGAVRNDLTYPVENVQLKVLVYDSTGRQIADRIFILPKSRLDPGVPAFFNQEIPFNNLPIGFQCAVQVVEARYVQPYFVPVASPSQISPEKAAEYFREYFPNTKP